MILFPALLPFPLTHKHSHFIFHLSQSEFLSVSFFAPERCIKKTVFHGSGKGRVLQKAILPEASRLAGGGYLKAGLFPENKPDEPGLTKELRCQGVQNKMPITDRESCLWPSNKSLRH
jgi:hypothetical protein